MSASNQSSRPRLGVVTPLANEEKTIDNFLDRVLVHLLPHDRVFCILDKMCTDGTKDIIAQRGQGDPRVVLVWAPQNRCVVDAYFCGYRTAFDEGCEWILEMDGGLSHLPEEIPQFIKHMVEGYDYVGGSRYLPGGRHNSPLNRVVVSRGGTILTRALLGSQMTDMTSGFECFNRKAMRLVLNRGVASRANFFQTEIRHMMHQLRWVEVPISYNNENYRIGRSSIREAFRILWSMRQEESSERRTA